ncbi:peptidase [Clostridium polyendosporum]|uniref:Peptidase n=1 Tax=Clostridium polyendosporum TaxID=69208 RepID=A0A919VGW8_9CLOT|nr:GDSL-type esterase/lipase family protein [Clostridium polyendosporum]GIM29627.1 peptidase [Clostridium polyendosporum]
MKIICIGDSLTFGYGVNLGNSWVDLLRNKTKNEIINKGVNGDTTTGMLSRFSTDVTNHSPDMVSIMAGTNDLLMGRDLNTIVDNILLMIKESTDNNIIPIVIIPPLTLPNLAKKRWYSTVNYDFINSQICSLKDKLTSKCGELHIKLINFSSIVPLEEDYFSDGVHPNEKGHTLMFNKILSCLQD